MGKTGFLNLSEGLQSFVQVARHSDFPLENLPFGVFRPISAESAEEARPGVAIGDYVLDLSVIAHAGLFSNPHFKRCFSQTSLNMFLEMGRPAWKEARATIQKLLSADEPQLRDNLELREKSLLPMSEVEMLLPVVIGEYFDVCTVQHAENYSLISDRSDSPVSSNRSQDPIIYQRGASSIVVSGTDIIRPRGKAHRSGDSSYLAPTRKLDYELKMAAVVGPGNDSGQPVDVDKAANHIFGVVLMNDWIARDIEAPENVSVGLPLGKNFCTTISPWIVTLEALKPFACDARKADQHLTCLNEKKHLTYDIPLQVWIRRCGHNLFIGMNNLNYLPLTLTQLVALYTRNGQAIRPGDLLGTGIIYRKGGGSYGCLQDLARDPDERVYDVNGYPIACLANGDSVITSGACKGKGYNVGFGDCIGTIVRAIPQKKKAKTEL